MRSHSRILIAGGAALAVGLAVPSVSMAAPAPPDTLAQGLVGPLQIDVGDHGQVYAAQDFIGFLTKIRKNGSTKDLTTYPGEVAGVASRGYQVAFTTTNGGETTPTTAAFVMVRRTNGSLHKVANLYRFEKRHNPDSVNTYGFTGLSAKCEEALAPLADEIGPPTYSGIIDSHPYSLANAPGGGWYVAEAAGNDILKVSRSGHVRVVSVLPPQFTKVTAEIAAGIGLPDCTVGHKYGFEPVPTDVEVGPGGQLYVSLLPGGPEDASLGARGSVVRINPKNGHQKVIARGFLGTGNVAVTPHGKVYVTEIFANQISVIRHGHGHPVMSVPTPSGLEYSHGKLYASVDVFGNGSVISFSP